MRRLPAVPLLMVVNVRLRQQRKAAPDPLLSFDKPIIHVCFLAKLTTAAHPYANCNYLLRRRIYP